MAPVLHCRLHLLYLKKNVCIEAHICLVFFLFQMYRGSAAIVGYLQLSGCNGNAYNNASLCHSAGKACRASEKWATSPEGQHPHSPSKPIQSPLKNNNKKKKI